MHSIMEMYGDVRGTIMGHDEYDSDLYARALWGC